MNQGVGSDPYSPSFGKLPVNGPWLDGNHGNTRSGPWFVYNKDSAWGDPGPANTFVLLDEDPYSINDAGFAVSAAQAKWVDYVGVYHNKAGGFGFADGHSEIHKWKDSRTPTVNQASEMSSVPNSVDYDWVVDHATARKDGKPLPR
jgi:prepilin-type processing-associated H-X9-DG protein